MAFRHGRFAEITVNSVDLSAFCDSADINIDIDTAETTTFGKSWKTHIAGLASGAVAISGSYDPTATTGPASALTALVGADAFPVVLHPGGNTTGQIEHSFNALLTNYTEKSAVGDKVKFSASIISDGTVTTSNV
jgi:hypothetical protein